MQHELSDGGSEFTLSPEGFHESLCADIPADDVSYERIATVTEIEGASHVAMISHPKEVAEVVMTAVRTCTP